MSDADTVYRVLTVYDSDTSRGEAGWGRLAVVFDHVLSLAARAKDLLGGVVESIVHVGSAAENARIAIAGLFNATAMPGAANFNVALQMSSEIMAQMRRDAAALPGTFEDLQEIFQRAIPGGARSGRSVSEIEHMSSQMMAVGKAFGLHAEIIGREFAELMEGRASIRLPLFAKMMQFMGPDMSTAKFNAMAAPEKWAAMQEALSHFGPMIKEYGSTWDAVSSTTESYLQNLLRIGSGGIFDRLKTELGALNAWYERNQEKVDSFVSTLGGRLAEAMISGFKAIKDAVSYIVENRETLLSIAEGVAAMFALRSLGGGGAGAGGAFAAAVNPAIPGVGGSLFGVLGGAGLGFALAKLTDQAGLLGTASVTLLGAFSALPGPIGLVATALTGLSIWLSDVVDKDAKSKSFARGELGDPLALLKRYEAGGSVLTKQIGGEVASYLEQHGITKKEGGLNMHALSSFLMLGNKLNAWDVTGAAALRNLALRTEAAGFLKPRGKEVAFGPELPTQEQRIQQLLAERGKAVTEHTTHIAAVNVYNNIYDAEDPARVIQKLTAKAIADNIRHPAQSASVPVLR